MVALPIHLSLRVFRDGHVDKLAGLDVIIFLEACAVGSLMVNPELVPPVGGNDTHRFVGVVLCVVYSPKNLGSAGC